MILSQLSGNIAKLGTSLGLMLKLQLEHYYMIS